MFYLPVSSSYCFIYIVLHKAQYELIQLLATLNQKKIKNKNASEWPFVAFLSLAILTCTSKRKDLIITKC